MSFAEKLPCIIQGGMGVGVSNWRLAGAVAKAGGLGVVAGTALDTVLARRLQLGDAGGHVRRALAAFPFSSIARRIERDYFVEGGIAQQRPFRLLSLPNARMKLQREALFVAAAFVEVYLAKEGHAGPIGINLLEKIQVPTLPSLFGAMLAGVDVVLMGAGIPHAIPGVLDAFSRLESAEIKLQVEDNPERLAFSSRFEPAAFIAECSARAGAGEPEAAEKPDAEVRGLKRPVFLAIISSHILAKTLHKKASGRVDGFVVESHVAGGHNAPPRKRATGTVADYGLADAAELDVLRQIGLPFWLAGCRAGHGSLAEARALGARGIQVGTVFAYCAESGIREDIKQRMINGLRQGTARVETDFEASPTGYPFKLVLGSDRPEELSQLRARERVCDLGYLRQAYVDRGGKLAFRCPGEPVETYLAKGGNSADTRNKVCLCNGLLATIGLGQRRELEDELPVRTAGEGLNEILSFVSDGNDSYSAADVIERLSAGALVSAAE